MALLVAYKLAAPKAKSPVTVTAGSRNARGHRRPRYDMPPTLAAPAPTAQKLAVWKAARSISNSFGLAVAGYETTTTSLRRK